MGNLFNALNDLKTNIFGGGNTGQTAPILRKSAIGINEESPVSKLDHDPFAYSSIQYPRDLTSNGGIGHYMLFYVNVQDKTKYNYEDSEGAVVGNEVEVPITETRVVKGVPQLGIPDTTREVVVGSKFIRGDSKEEFKYSQSLNRRGKKGTARERSEERRVGKECRSRWSR